jgi:hypothetical protein
MTAVSALFEAPDAPDGGNHVIIPDFTEKASERI